MPEPAPTFTLWLEFETYAGGYPQPGDDPDCDFCNALVRADGRVCGLNIWTFRFLDHVRRFDEFTGEPKPAIERFLLPPDLLVERLDRALIEASIATLLLEDFPPQWCWKDEQERTEDENDR
ncbi:MAG: hypothetical protein E6Q50_02795 [Lysobacter sp.]|nr:MAG: hypothetical protein E6Q50_02795 [Lysobacter sp.]